MRGDEDIAWAAGLFEGEGCITKNKGIPVLKLTMTDEDVVRRFGEVMGTGSVTGPYENSKKLCENPKPLWWWAAYGMNALIAYSKLHPWLGTRRREQFVAASE